LERSGVAVHGLVVNEIFGLSIIGVKLIAKGAAIVANQLRCRITDGKASRIAGSVCSGSFIVANVVRVQFIKDTSLCKGSGNTL
jgi:hypothetical protein